MHLHEILIYFSHGKLNGLVEATWYLPSGEISEDKLINDIHSDNDKDPFNNVVTFLNLRGNAREHKNQLYWLTHINSNQKQMHNYVNCQSYIFANLS